MPSCKVATESHNRPFYHASLVTASKALCLLVVGVLRNRVAMQSQLPQVFQRAKLLNLCQKKGWSLFCKRTCACWFRHSGTGCGHTSWRCLMVLACRYMI